MKRMSVSDKGHEQNNFDQAVQALFVFQKVLNVRHGGCDMFRFQI